MNSTFSETTRNALYGINGANETAWFCWRKIAGCKGVVARHTNEKMENIHDDSYAHLDAGTSFLELPSNYQRLNDGSYGVHTRPQFRSEDRRGLEDLMALEKAEIEDSTPESREYTEYRLHDYGIALSAMKAQRGQTTGSPVSSPPVALKILLGVNDVPAIVSCPVCKAKNKISSFRSSNVDIRFGRLLT